MKKARQDVRKDSWRASQREPQDQSTGPEENNGNNNGTHGAPDHQAAMDRFVNEHKTDPSTVRGMVRADQQQVDVNGNPVGTRGCPDAQRSGFNQKDPNDSCSPVTGMKQEITESDRRSDIRRHESDRKAADPNASVDSRGPRGW